MKTFNLIVATAAVVALTAFAAQAQTSSSSTWGNGATTSVQTDGNGTATVTGPRGGVGTATTGVTYNEDGTRTRNTDIMTPGGKQLNRSVTRGQGGVSVNRAFGGTRNTSR